MFYVFVACQVLRPVAWALPSDRSRVECSLVPPSWFSGNFLDGGGRDSLPPVVEFSSFLLLARWNTFILWRATRAHTHIHTY